MNPCQGLLRKPEPIHLRDRLGMNLLFQDRPAKNGPALLHERPRMNRYMSPHLEQRMSRRREQHTNLRRQDRNSVLRLSQEQPSPGPRHQGLRLRNTRLPELLSPGRLRMKHLHQGQLRRSTQLRLQDQRLPGPRQDRLRRLETSSILTSVLF